MGQAGDARLDALVALVGRAACVADIGAGDLHLAGRMLDAGAAVRVVAVERAPGAFARARSRAAHDGRIEVRLGDGFAPVRPGEADAAVLAGLGGEAIVRVLTRAAAADSGAGPASLPARLVLAPTSETHRVREALYRLGYARTFDRVVAEGARLRWVVAAARGREGGAPTPGELEVGGLLCDRRAPLRAAVLQERLTVWRTQLAGATGERRRHLAAAMAEVEAAL